MSGKYYSNYTNEPAGRWKLSNFLASELCILHTYNHIYILCMYSVLYITHSHNFNLIKYINEKRSHILLLKT